MPETTTIYRAPVFPIAEDTVLRAIPGVLGFFGAIGFVVGIFDEHFRRDLWPVLVVCLALAVIGGLLYARSRRRHSRLLRIERGSEGLAADDGRVRVENAEVRHGLAEEWTGGRRYPVAWVALEGRGGVIVVRKGLGVAHARPEWPPSPVPQGIAFRGGPVCLFRALEKSSSVTDAD